MHTVAGDGVTSIKRRRRDLYSDDVKNFVMASRHGQLKEDLESYTLRRQETLTAEESGKGKGKEIVGSSLVNMIKDGKNNNNKNTKGKKRNNDSNNDGSNKKSKLTCWKCGKTGHFKMDCLVKKNNGRNTSGLGQGSKHPNPSQVLNSDFDVILFNHYVSHIYEICYVQDDAFAWWIDSGALVMHVRIVVGLRLFIHYKMDPFFIWARSQPNQYLIMEMAVVRLPEPKRKNLGEKGIDCIFIRYAEHSKAYRFYVIEPNEYISINSVIESRDEMLDEKRFTLIPRPKSLMPSSNEDKISETPTTHRSNIARVAKSFRSDFQLYLVEGSRDEIGPQYSYSYSIEEDPRMFDEAMQSRDVSIWKEAINDEKDSIMENNTWILSDLSPAATYNLVIHQKDVKTTFLNSDLEDEDMGEADMILGIRIKHEDKGITINQSHYIEKILKKFKCDDCCLVSTLLDPTIKLMPNTSRDVDQLECFRAIGCLMYAMTSTRPDIAYIVGKLSCFRRYSDASWITNSEDHTSTTGWVFLLSRGAILWASKKQTCITDSTMEA
ncbi:zinc finger, CCHC-type containing protein [Tanacetum coccineum]